LHARWIKKHCQISIKSLKKQSLYFGLKTHRKYLTLKCFVWSRRRQRSGEQAADLPPGTKSSSSSSSVGRIVINWANKGPDQPGGWPLLLLLLRDGLREHTNNTHNKRSILPVAREMHPSPVQPEALIHIAALAAKL
jgi:hypothetical protein